MKQSERTLIGSAYSRNRSASPRSTSPSSSSSASRGIMPWVRSSTSRGRNGTSVIDRIHRCSGPSMPSMFSPIVRFSVEGSVAAVNVSGSVATRFTSSWRVTSQRPTAGTKLTGSSSRRRA